MSDGKKDDIVNAVGAKVDEVVEPLKKAVKSLSEMIMEMVKSTKLTIRAFVILLVFLAVVIGFLEYFRRMWKDDFTLRFPLAGTAIILHSSENASDFRSAVFLVPASKCWVNTGLEIKNGDRITIRASGHVHLAMKQIEQEKIPQVRWSEPDGSPFKKVDGIDRSDLLILKHYDRDQQPLVGNLIGYFLPIGESSTEGAFPSANIPRPKAYGGVFHIGSHKENLLNDTGKTVHLWLSVNDIILDKGPKAEVAYKGGDQETFVQTAVKQAKSVDSLDKTELLDVKINAQKLWKYKQREWSKIKEQRAWDLYYYDNIGHYLVTVVKQ